MFVYIEIIKYDTPEGEDGVIKRLDVTDKSERSRDVVERVMNRNLNQDDYFTMQKSYEEKQEIIG